MNNNTIDVEKVKMQRVNSFTQKTIKTIYLNNLTYSDIKNFPAKLQIFFMLKFAQLSSLGEIDRLVKVSRLYQNIEQNTEQISDDLIFKLLESYSYDIIGIFYNTNVHWTLLKREYIKLWGNFVDSCMNRQHEYFNAGVYYDVPFDIAIIICEIFNISILPKHIPKLIKLGSYNEDNAIYMLKCGNVRFSVRDDETNLTDFMKAFEIMYDDAIVKNYEVLAQVIRTLPCFISYLPYEKIQSIVKSYPQVLNYNLNKNALTFDILSGSNDVISVKLRNLCNSEVAKEFKSTNKIMYVLLSNKIVVPLNSSYNKVFFNYLNKILTEMDLGIEYNSEINYSEELLKLHLEIMARPIVEIN